jgi:hypothetical protein
MSSAKGDFSRGNVPFLILRLGLPIMLAEIVAVLYNIVDRAYIGHMGETGTFAITGLGVCFPLITLISGFANLFSTGGCLLPYPVFCTNRATLGRPHYMGTFKVRVTEAETAAKGTKRITEDSYLRTV